MTRKIDTYGETHPRGPWSFTWVALGFRMKNVFTEVLAPHLVVRCVAILFRNRNVYPDQNIGYPEQDLGRLAQSIWAVY